MASKSSQVVSILFVALALASPALAQATRTWVSGVGDDVNPCSRTAPCKTFAGAISKTAIGGYIDIIDDGNFGPVTITKAITIDGGGASAILTLASSSITVNTTGVVTLRNLTIEGVTASTAVNVTQVGTLHVENVRINNFSSFGINFNPSGGGARLFVTDSTVTNISGGAAVYVRNAHATLERVFVSTSQSGIVSGAGGVTFVKNSVVTNCSMGFAAAYSAASVIDVQDSTSNDNDWGIVAGSGAVARVGNMTIADNHVAGLYNDGSSFIVSLGNNRVSSNSVDGTFTSTVSIR